MHARLAQALQRRPRVRLARAAGGDDEQHRADLVAEHDRIGEAQHRRRIDDDLREALAQLARAAPAASARTAAPPDSAAAAPPESRTGSGSSSCAPRRAPARRSTGSSTARAMLSMPRHLCSAGLRMSASISSTGRPVCAILIASASAVVVLPSPRRRAGDDELPAARRRASRTAAPCAPSDRPRRTPSARRRAPSVASDASSCPFFALHQRDHAQHRQLREPLHVLRRAAACRRGTRGRTRARCRRSARAAAR